jgi:hypothetical protein
MDGAPHERLRRARAACGEDLGALARRTGVRLHHLRAIESGRFSDLPAGIYARAAIRAFADACGLDPAAVVAECESHLPHVPDPIDALARRHGIAVPAPATGRGSAEAASHERRWVAPADENRAAQWRTFAAAAVDAAFVGTLLLLIVASVAALSRVPIGALSASAAPLALVGAVLGGGYFAWFGGLCGTTLGRMAVHAAPRASDREPLTLHAIAVRALSSATDDARAIVALGLRIARKRATPGAPQVRSVPRLARALSRLRRLDLGPARWSPASRPGAAPPQPLPRPRG